MILADIYDRFSIPDNLRTHMLRVAGVGKVICENLSPDIKIDKDLLIKTLLVHDMGNIVKFDLSIKDIHPDAKENNRLKQIKKEFVLKYGNDPHAVTENILKEIGTNKSIIAIMNNMIAEKLNQTLLDIDFMLIITTYSDYRVAPNGVVSLNERINDLVTRLSNKPSSHWSKAEKVEEYRSNLSKCEGMIQKYCTIDLNNINDQMVERYFDDFLIWEMA